MQPRLSVCMIARNEQSILGRALSSIKDTADECIVVDTGSTDATIEIAQKHNALVHTFVWNNDFAAARNESLAHATGSWILWLDADDVLDPASIPLLNSLKQTEPLHVLSMIVRNQRPDGTGTEFRQARMFPHKKGIVFEGAIHEQIVPCALRHGLTLKETEVVIEHHGYATPDVLIAKARRNVEILLTLSQSRSSDPVLCIEIADSYFIMHDDATAEQWYHVCLEIPGVEQAFSVLASQAYRGLGTMRTNQGRYQEAILYLLRAHYLCPQRTDVLYGLAVAYEHIQEISSAMTALSQILDMEHCTLSVGVDYRQTEIKAYLRLCRLYLENTDVELTTKLCKRALDRFPQRVEILNMAGLAYIRLHTYKESLHCFEKSLSINKDRNFDAYAGLCVIYSKAHQHHHAKTTLATSYVLFKEYPLYWALVRMLGIDLDTNQFPCTVSTDIINQHLIQLRNMYGIV